MGPISIRTYLLFIYRTYIYCTTFIWSIREEKESQKKKTSCEFSPRKTFTRGSIFAHGPWPVAAVGMCIIIFSLPSDFATSNIIWKEENKKFCDGFRKSKKRNSSAKVCTYILAGWGRKNPIGCAPAIVTERNTVREDSRYSWEV